VLSGLTVEEVKAGRVAKSTLREALEQNGAPRVRVDPRKVEAMHAEPADEAFTREGWFFELKLDGYRLIASKSKGEALLLTRNGNDYTEVFPEIARAVKALPVDDCIIDGEVVVCDARGMPSFRDASSGGERCRRQSRSSEPPLNCLRRFMCSTFSRSRITTCGLCHFRSASNSCST
jgi:ATP-dependent DNA ligase